MASDIERELQKATQVKAKKGEGRQEFLAKIAQAADKLEDTDFDGLSEGAQEWVNEANEEFKKALERNREPKYAEFEEEDEPLEEEAEEASEDEVEPDEDQQEEFEEEMSTKKAAPAKKGKTVGAKKKAKVAAKDTKVVEKKSAPVGGDRAPSRKLVYTYLLKRPTAELADVSKELDLDPEKISRAVRWFKQIYEFLVEKGKIG